ncbi:hypothetical protein QUF72_02830 [Desulfobacterales bacterium HSG2]|nr:hypothetical protein [Desulfobacterales bacterium HSG2]
MSLKLWVDTWKKAGAELNQIKQRQLESYDYEKHQNLIDQMLQFAYENRKSRPTSGLVEQQKWFMKMGES